MTKRLLNQRQANWASIISQYDCVFKYRPGTENTIADLLSRKATDLKSLKSRKDEERTLQIFEKVESDIFAVDDKNLPSLQLVKFCVLDNEEKVPPLSGVILAEKLLEMNRTDQDMEIYRLKAREKVPYWTFLKDFVLYKVRLVVSSKNNLRTKIIEDLHSRILTAHPGRNKTRKLLCSKFWWPNMNGDIDVYVENYPCKSAKSPRDKTLGLLRPIPIPLRPWHHIIVDFKYMPKAKDGSDNTFNIIDKLTNET